MGHVLNATGAQLTTMPFVHQGQAIKWRYINRVLANDTFMLIEMYQNFFWSRICT
jgi:hypothetical protein